MTFQLKNILTFIITFGILSSCSNVDTNENTNLTSETDKNIFPIEYVGYKALEYNKPLTSPKGGPAHISDTFNIYKLTNKYLDTIWVSTLKHNQDTSGYFFKDTSIKTITMGKISYRYIERKEWFYPSEGNCWGNCDFRVCLLPNQSLLLNMGLKCIPDFDSTMFNIHLKIKRGQKLLDTSITKQLVLTKNHFVDDTKKWTN